MRTVELARIAAEAEIVRVQQMLKRQAMRAVFAVAAAIFALGALTLATIAGWQLLRTYFDPLYATLILLGGYLVVAILFGVLAMRSSPSRTEQEALAVRKEALTSLQRSVAISTLVPIAGTLWRMRRGNPKAANRHKRLFSRG